MGKAKVLWTLIGSLIVLLSVVTWSWYKQASDFKTVATIGSGQSITEAEYLAKLKKKYGKQVLEDMINRKTVFLEAERLGVTVDPKQEEAELAKIRDSYGGEQAFAAALKQQLNIDESEVREQIRYQLLLKELATKEVAISDDDLLTYYNNHKENYAQPMKVHAWQIVVASMTEAKQVLRELKDGANFSTLAKERSIDSLTSANGGDLGWITGTGSDLTDEEQAVLAQLELNEDSQPLKVNDRYVILRVVERKGAVQQSFDEVKEQIRQDMALAQVDSLDQVLERLKQAANVHIIGETSN